MLKNASEVTLVLNNIFYLKIFNFVQSFAECKVSLADGTHLNGFSFVCTLEWRANSAALENCFPQNWQENTSGRPTATTSPVGSWTVSFLFGARLITSLLFAFFPFAEPCCLVALLPTSGNWVLNNFRASRISFAFLHPRADTGGRRTSEAEVAAAVDAGLDRVVVLRSPILFSAVSSLRLSCDSSWVYKK